MSHVTRYECVANDHDAMEVNVNGEFVKFEDYKKLETALREIKRYAETFPQDRTILKITERVIGGA